MKIFIGTFKIIEPFVITWKPGWLVVMPSIKVPLKELLLINYANKHSKSCFMG